jgi:hypothetical protein
VAALEVQTGVATGWDPDAQGTGVAGDGVYALAVSHSTVYAGGFFSSIGGKERRGIAVLDATTGLAARRFSLLRAE